MVNDISLPAQLQTSMKTGTKIKSGRGHASVAEERKRRVDLGNRVEKLNKAGNSYEDEAMCFDEHPIF